MMNSEQFQHIQFNQASLQDFDDCHRRFYLRHVRKLAWPAVKSQPIKENEIFREQGVAFHRMVHQYFLGVPEKKLSDLYLDEPIRSWWRNFLFSKQTLPGLTNPDGRLLPEFSLTTSIENHKLTAKFDLIAVTPEAIIIYDWKTSQQHPLRKTLENRLQTIVYPFVVAKSGAYLVHNKESFKPENICLTYWFVNDPENPEQFQYSRQQMKKDEANLISKVALIESMIERGEDGFELTTQEKRCSYCTYRSLCNRGVHAAEIEQSSEIVGFESIELSFDQITEIEF